MELAIVFVSFHCICLPVVLFPIFLPCPFSVLDNCVLLPEGIIEPRVLWFFWSFYHFLRHTFVYHILQPGGKLCLGFIDVSVEIEDWRNEVLYHCSRINIFVVSDFLSGYFGYILLYTYGDRDESMV